MNLQNFNYNSKQFWIGIIEDRLDPLGLGRCRVRIIGYHTDDKSLLPTTDLPWASCIFPVNASKTFQSPPLNEWVLGMFMDGMQAQFPIILGIIPGLKQI